jgi:murein DD-endopeptidase MepM/ murein hydrolase activator NlpD
LDLKHKIKYWFRTRFLFVIRKEQDFAVITSFSITVVKAALIFIFLLISLFGFSLIMSKTFLKQWFDPAHAESANMSRILMLSETVDSLSAEINQKNIYVLNLQRILNGGEMPDIQEFEPTIIPDDNGSDIRAFEPSEETKMILEEFRGTPLNLRSASNSIADAFTDNYFYPPLKGLITATFAPQNDHFGVDVVTKENEPVKAIAGGTVFFTSWTLETGYVIAIQHTNELISIYKHNSVLLKSIGDIVRGGEILSIIGNTGELTTGPHLHFEMWYKGNPLNPQEFISF